MPTFRLVFAYDLLEDSHIKDVNNSFFVSLLYKMYRFHVFMHLFSNRSQKTSKWGKNISDGLCATFLFLQHFNIICDLLLNRRMATWNLFVKH